MSGDVLIGRERELAELDERLRSHRVVTVVGPGGVGKTALAVDAAERARSRFELGVHRVDLTRVDVPAAVAGALASQLGYDSWDALLGAPEDRPALVLVDNCEHLLDAAASAIAALLRACDAPTILATSRSPLEIPGEAVFALAPLEVPDRFDPEPQSSAAVQLFLARARDAGATIDPADVDVVASLCRRLDGLPLALELAAARARTLSVAEIAGRLDAGVDVLARRHYRGERRHRSIVDTIRWSYDLLSEEQADLLDRLSVFAGPFSRSAAQAVVDGLGRTGDFDDDLDELVYTSLVAVDTGGNESRHRLLDTVRQFATHRLAERDARDETMDRFVDVVLERALASIRGGRVAWRPEMIRDLLAAFEDIAEALRWCNDRDDEPDRALGLCAVLWTVVHQGRADDVVVLARQTVARWSASQHRRVGAAAATLASAEYLTGSPTQAIELAEATLGSRSVSPTAEVKLRRVIAQARTAIGDVPGAIDAAALGALLARDHGLTAMAIELEIVHAHLGTIAGHIRHGVDSVEAAAEEAAAAGSPVTTVWARTTLGWLLLRERPDDAIVVVEAALAAAREIGYPIGIAGNLRSLAYAHLLRGDLRAAHAALTELLDELLAHGALSDARLLVDAAATLAHAAGHPGWAELAATARSLPFVSLLLTDGTAPVLLPPSGAAARPRLEAVAATKRVLEELADLDDAADPSPTHQPTPTVDGERPRLVARGAVWDIAFEGTEVAVRSSKGLLDLARLLAQPDREIHCLDLVGAGVGETSTGEVIDAQARARYEGRIRELQSEIEEAEEANDYLRAERHQAEFDVLVDHLTSALGAGGRTRRSADTAERARSAVTQRVRSTMRRIEELHPSLGRHLRSSIVTGFYCCYRPARSVEWVIDASADVSLRSVP